MILLNKRLDVTGNGLWSNTNKPITIIGFTLKSYVSNNKLWGNVNLYFNTAEWDTKSNGLIYTDALFLNEVKKLLASLGLDTKNMDYSEAGMQGKDFVNFDVDSAFIESFWKMYLEEKEKPEYL